MLKQEKMNNNKKNMAEPTENDIMCDKRFSFFETKNSTAIPIISDKQKKTPIIMIAKNKMAVKPIKLTKSIVIRILFSKLLKFTANAEKSFCFSGHFYSVSKKYSS